MRAQALPAGTERQGLLLAWGGPDGDGERWSDGDQRRLGRGRGNVPKSIGLDRRLDDKGEELRAEV